jgi:hypothetical protein
MGPLVKQLACSHATSRIAQTAVDRRGSRSKKRSDFPAVVTEKHPYRSFR